MMSPLVRAAVVAVLLVPAVAGAQVYRCQVDGKTAYQSVPCPGGGAKVETQAPSFGGTADDPVRDLRRIENERERRRDLADIDRRHDDAVARSKKNHCNWLKSRVDRYQAHERSEHGQSMRDWYGAERKAAEARYDRECR